MTIVLKDTDFLKCGVCAVFPVNVYRDVEQYACSNGHFICSECCIGGRARCGCGASLKLVSEVDEEFTRVAPYYAKRLVHACDHCHFHTTDETVLEAHRSFSCEANRQPSADRVVARATRRHATITSANSYIDHDCNDLGSLTVRFDTAVILVDATSKTVHMQTRGMKEVMYAVIRTASHIIYGFFSDTGHTYQHALKLQGVVQVALYNVFAPPTPDPFVPARPTTACHVSVPRWAATLNDGLAAAAHDALVTCTPWTPPAQMSKPAGACLALVELRGFECIARRIFRESFRGGLLFFVPGIAHPGIQPINPFYVYLVDTVMDDQAVICPGCFGCYNFSLSGYSICAHLEISPAYFMQSATRIEMESGYPIQRQTMTSCMQRVHAANFAHEILPSFERNLYDHMPMHAKLRLIKSTVRGRLDKIQYFGKMLLPGGRPRLVAICVEKMEDQGAVYFDDNGNMVRPFDYVAPSEVSCAMCDEKICTLPISMSEAARLVGAHFMLPRDMIAEFGLLLFDTEYSKYIIEKIIPSVHDRSFLKHEGIL